MIWAFSAQEKSSIKVGSSDSKSEAASAKRGVSRNANVSRATSSSSAKAAEPGTWRRGNQDEAVRQRLGSRYPWSAPNPSSGLELGNRPSLVRACAGDGSAARATVKVSASAQTSGGGRGVWCWIALLAPWSLMRSLTFWMGQDAHDFVEVGIPAARRSGSPGTSPCPDWS